MAAPIQIILTQEEERTLAELRMASTLPQRTRDRDHMLRINAQGWIVPAISGPLKEEEIMEFQGEGIDHCLFTLFTHHLSHA
ncbi:hypothetical protein [Neosynechococcus sphagnicola]|uniref:hypothetical protein n=1 Tax=Neosynechococcus sphagnicola TaxID=1501145 RepID=UPI00068FE8BD|nr:hypothetical protein [Neosynechococcus sphagnicola]